MRKKISFRRLLAVGVLTLAPLGLLIPQCGGQPRHVVCGWQSDPGFLNGLLYYQCHQS